MKKIYMILAALSLLSLSLNAQLLPEKQRSGTRNTASKGLAYLYTPNGKFRMPTLSTDEYLFGPYVTDDFDATGASLYNMYNRAQNVTVVVDMLRSEFEEHIGDSIIGFRFALAGSNPVYVYDFGMYPANDEEYAEESTVWSLGQLMGGNTSTQTETTTVTSPVDVTFTSASSATYSLTNNDVTITTGINELGGYTNMYLNGTTTISTTNGTITKIVFNGSSASSYPVSRLSAATGNFSVSNNVGTWTGSASSVNFSSTQDAGCSSIVVTVERETTQTVTTNTVEIGRGSSKYEHLPVSGYNQDYGYHNQMIYRAGQLAMASGAQIRSLTFYPEENIGLPFSGSTVTVKLANTTTDNFGTGSTSNMITSGLTTVATITPVANSGATEWTINFSTPFTYNGNNLVVDISCPGYRNDGTTGQFAHTNFKGDNQSVNVSITNIGHGSTNTTSGTPNAFLPKATFSFTGNINTPDYLTLQGGEWHDFFLEEPVVFSVPDGYDYLSIGYTYYQQYSSAFAPVAYNSNSTGRDHWGYGYGRSSSTSSYEQSWWSQNSRIGGNLAVQLIFKKAKQKTPTPTITFAQDNQYGHVTATATDPSATVTLTVGGQTATGVGSVTINIGRGEQDVVVNATATAQEPDKLVSDPATGTYTVQASTLDPTPTPDINSSVLDLTVKVDGTGEGTVHMYIDGQEVANPEYLERGTTDYTVTVTVTAIIEDGEHRMTTTTKQVLVPALTQQQIDQLTNGWTELPGTYSNNSVINWNNNLMFIDRFKVSTADNDHPAKYTYVMTENKTKLTTPLRSTNEHIIPVQLTRSKVHGFFTETQVTEDRDRQHVTPFVMNADAEMYLEQSPDIYYYTLDRSRNSIEDANFLELSRLQGDGSRYVEMNENFTLHEPFNLNEPVQRYDTINTMLPASATQGNKGMHFGSYDNQDYISYVPIIWTFGNMPTNKRANWDNDGIHNSYGSPIWKTGVGKVTMLQPDVEKQIDPKWGTTSWTEGTTKCNLYMITDLVADGYLPSREVSNIKYEPYMFRVFVESSNGKLRGYDWAKNEQNDGMHCVTTNEGALNGPICIWEEMINENSANVTFDEATGIATFHKVKADRENDNVVWTIPEEMNIMFGAEDGIQWHDITIYVRFYYKSTGKSINEKQPAAPTLRADGDEEPAGEPEVPMFYAAEGEQDPDNQHIFTSINGVFTGSHGEIVGVTYVNAQGMQSDKPFDGLNIVITRYSDGTTTNTKVIR